MKAAEDAKQYLYQLRKSGVKLGLENMQQLCREMANPESCYPIVHIAGTNGKGSCAVMLESILQHAGYRVGLFTSPHLIRFNERIRVSGYPISDEDLVSETAALKHNINQLNQKGVEPTFFEATNGLAFQYFKNKKVDIAIIETGLGGRLDSTNVLTPIVSLITSIGMDHCGILGDTLASIAFEKAGIIKMGVPVVSGVLQEEASSVIEDVAKRRNARLIQPGSIKTLALNHTDLGRTIAYDQRVFQLALPAKSQCCNVASVLEVIEELRRQDFEISEQAIEEGLRTVKWPGRFDRIESKPLVVLDCAHNDASLSDLFESWSEWMEYPPSIVVLGFLSDKLSEPVIAQIRAFIKSSKRLLIVPVTSERASDPNAIKELFLGGPETSVLGDVEELWHEIRRLDSLDSVLIFGSVYLAGEILAHHQGIMAQSKLNG
ncbi:MAG: folylpolyglutamate synthase/dihydrofolate synthase family protein [Verrucomicrobiota bacterium]